MKNATPSIETESESDPQARRRRTKRPLTKGRILKRLGVALAAVLIVAGGAGYWALDRFVIDHVEVADVASYEAELASSGEVQSVDLDTLEDTEATDNTFTSDGVTIEITTKVVGSGQDQITYFVADVQLDDAARLQGGFADNQFGTNIVEYTSDIAKANDAIFAINGDYYGFRDTGIVIRNGVLYRDAGAREGLAIYADGHMELYDETQTTGQALIDAGVLNTVSFGPALVDDGQIIDGIEDVEVDTNFGNHSVQGNQPRTGIGMIDNNHFVFVVADGRSQGYSRGVSMTEFAQIFVDAGAKVAYNLDGGGSSTMYFNGSLVNNPLGRNQERGTSDILYIAG